MEELITTRQLSTVLKVRESTIYKWVHYGFIPHYKLGRQVRFKLSQINRWLQKRFIRGRIRYKLSSDEL
ncbi:MAG: helix-turn-helix domain-containing protein [Candidatus Omnitrophica bacterium]|nr:helix-turn-helix domain-containing protein [Candidatus Omnitrophota bacterium]